MKEWPIYIISLADAHARRAPLEEMFSGVLRTTGPIAYTQAIRPILGQYEHRIVDIERDCGFHYTTYRGESKRRHKALWGPHYSQVNLPIVKPDVGDRIALCPTMLARGARRAATAASGALKDILSLQRR